MLSIPIKNVTLDFYSQQISFVLLGFGSDARLVQPVSQTKTVFIDPSHFCYCRLAWHRDYSHHVLLFWSQRWKYLAAEDDIMIGSDWEPPRYLRPKSKPCFITYFTLDGTIFYKTNILCLQCVAEDLKLEIWGHKLIRKPFIKVIIKLEVV